MTGEMLRYEPSSATWRMKETDPTMRSYMNKEAIQVLKFWYCLETEMKFLVDSQ